MQNEELKSGVNQSHENVNGTTNNQNLDLDLDLDMSMTMNLHYHNPLVTQNNIGFQPNIQNYPMNGSTPCISQMFGPNAPGTIPNMTSDSSNMSGAQQMVYLQSLAGVTNMVAAVQPSTTSSEDMHGDSSTTSSSVQQNLQGHPYRTGGIQKQSFTAPASHPSMLGGVQMPSLPPNISTAMQVEFAAAAAAAAAAPPKGYHGPKPHQRDMDTSGTAQTINGCRGTKRPAQAIDLTVEEKKQQNRERNREHAKSTRLRKKAYVNKLKELVDGLHAERSEEVRKRRVSMQHLAEVQRVRRAVIKDFLQAHSHYESDPMKWSTLLEDSFLLYQPVTPYRSFRKVEIENQRDRERRNSKGIDTIISDAASMSVMVESVGKRSARWKHIKRDEFLRKEEVRTRTIRSRMPRSIVRQDSRFQHSISNLSSSSGYSTGDSGEEDKKKRSPTTQKAVIPNKTGQANKRKMAGSSSSGGSGQSSDQHKPADNMFHDYHAQPLPDPKLDSGGSAGSNSITGNDSNNAVAGKYINTASPSGDEEKPKRLLPNPPTLDIITGQSELPPTFPRVTVKAKGVSVPKDATVPISDPIPSTNHIGNDDSKVNSGIATLPSNIAQKGGIFHNVRPAVASARELNPRLRAAPATMLPPFTGLGKSKPKAVDRDVCVSTSRSNSSSSCVVADRAKPPEPVNIIYSSAIGSSSPQPMNAPVEARPIIPNPSNQVANLIGADNDGRSSEDSASTQIQAFYHVNEDDMLLTDDVLMCPFIFRTQDAVLCGALAECVMPGMLRAQFSNRNKLLSLEMVYDAMGFMQQLGRASGNEAVAEIIPNSLEMSLQPTDEARVITEAKPPFSIVSVNSLWTKLTKFTQLDVEKKDISILEGKKTDSEAIKRQGKPSHTPSEVARGRAACSTNEFYDKYGNAFVAFVASYPLTNSSNEVTHILHIYNELPEYQ